MTTGEKITLLRKKIKLTQDELAEKLGVSRQSVSRWEVDIAFPETDKLIKLSKLFKCSIDFLLDEDKEENVLYQDNRTEIVLKDCYKFIRECGYFFLATSVKDSPKLRPMGMIYANDKSLYFVTDKRKSVYAELMENACVQIASYNPVSHQWVRITGKALIESARQIAEEVVEAYPMLKQKYPQNEADSLVVFEVLADEIKMI